MSAGQTRVVIVTGSSGGIGTAITRRLNRDEMRVAQIDIVPPREEPDASSSKHFRCDVTRTDEITQVVGEVLHHFGSIDAIINNAGMNAFIPLLDLQERDWDKVLRLNLTAPFLLSQAVVRHWIEQNQPGLIVNVTSLASHIAFPNAPAYNASKGGLRMLTKSMAHDLAHYGIRVNSVAPGAILTQETQDVLTTPDRRRKADAWVPLGMGLPERISDAVAFLLSEDATYVTGHELVVDGGLSVGLTFPDFGSDAGEEP